MKFLALLSIFAMFGLSSVIGSGYGPRALHGSASQGHLYVHPLQDNPSPPELDLLVIVDQSASMDKTDPKSLRFQVLSYVLDTLSAYHAALSDNMTFRVAVIYFGASSQRVFE